MTSGCLDRKEVRGQPVETQDVFFWRLAGRSAPTGLAIVHWIGSINAIKYYIDSLHLYGLIWLGIAFHYLFGRLLPFFTCLARYCLSLPVWPGIAFLYLFGQVLPFFTCLAWYCLSCLAWYCLSLPVWPGIAFLYLFGLVLPFFTCLAWYCMLIMPMKIWLH